MLLTNVVLSAYCSCRLCCGVSNQPTASGTWPKEGRTIAAPPGVPFGTRVWIRGIGVRIVEDRVNYQGRWDLFINNHKRAKKFGLRQL